LTKAKIDVIINTSNEREVTNMTYEFNDRVTGEDFLVEAQCEADALETAQRYFDEPKCFGAVTEEEAEMLGWDTY
jgi:hypothetical protein